MSRRTKTLLPIHEDLLKPKVCDVRDKMISAKERQALYYDKHAKDLIELKPRDIVRIQPSQYNKEGQKGVVIHLMARRSYEVRTNTHGVLRQSRRHLILTKEHPPHTPNRLDQLPNNNNDNDIVAPNMPNNIVVPEMTITMIPYSRR